MTLVLVISLLKSWWIKQIKLTMWKKSAVFQVLCSILLHQFKSINGAVMISPFPRAVICHVEDHLEVMCSTNESSFLNWNLAFLGTNERIERSITSNQQVQEIVNAHSTVFVFSRTSELLTLPFESTLEIISVSKTLNGSTITCMESSSAMAPMVTTTVYIVGENDAYHPSPPEVSLEEQFGVENITVVLQWTEELNNSLVTHHVNVEPMAHVITSNSRANLTLSYNTPYNVSVVADVCGGFNASTTRMVNYVNCGTPSLDGSVLVIGHTDVSLEGDRVTFSCSSGLVLTGPNMSTCMRNGKWEPDPREMVCEGDNESSSNSHQQLSEGMKIAVASVSVFFVTFALAFTVGFLCGHCCHKQRQLAKTSESAGIKMSPLYEVIPPTAMNKNIAYSMQPTNTDSEIDLES